MAQERYAYHDRDHTFKEIASTAGILYGLNWVGYYASQPDTFREKGSFRRYADNFGKVVFDNDEPFWNLQVHPLVGSQLYLFFRGKGYSQSQAVGMSALQSTLFEFLMEVYTEPASLQDLYQTPVLGGILGYGLEHLSLKLLNHRRKLWNVVGHILNPSTLLPGFEGSSLTVAPTVVHGRSTMGMQLGWNF